jgi:hypothetical protein
MECLRQLQKTNPRLLLTAAELHKAERDARYVPAVSSALASILCKSNSPVHGLVASIHRWSETEVKATDTCDSDDGQAGEMGEHRSTRGQIQELGISIEGRLRLVLSHGGKAKAEDEAKAEGEGGAENESQDEGEHELGMDDVLAQSSEEGDQEDKSGPNSQTSDHRRRSISQTQGDSLDDEDEYEDWL